ncbi:MAG: exodeoxyribonuclease VII large subunit [Lentisphaeria bacterium]|nr:exodeoxyribonuclease VII large subunit [Lentisphaeria bacterium]
MASDDRHIWSVTELNTAVRDLIAGSLLPFWVCGEVGNLTLHRSGHAYMTLKDASSQVRAVYFGGASVCAKMQIREGSKIEAYGRVSCYLQRGEYQFNISSLRPMGIGDLQRQFEELKRKLAEEGLFDESRKKPIPFLPTRIGVVTSPEGAALQDFLKIALARFPMLTIRIYPSPVQGKGAEFKIAEGVRYFNQKRNVDVIVVTRGGGSLEDLWPFNEEVVGRAIAESRIPVVSGVGHEVDFTIADFAADLRAPTPSGAAELIVPEKAAIDDLLSTQKARILAAISLCYERAKRDLDTLLNAEPLRRPSFFVMEKSQEIDLQVKEMEHLLANAAAQTEQQLAALSDKLQTLSPYAIMNRGYSMIFLEDGAAPLTDPAAAPAGCQLTAHMAKGRLKLRSEGPAPDTQKTARK